MPRPICDSCDKSTTGDISNWIKNGIGRECTKGLKYPRRRFRLSKKERDCIERLTDYISEFINDAAFDSGFSERNIDGDLMTEIKRLTDSINECLRGQSHDQPLIQIKNLTYTLKEPREKEHGGDWIIIIEYYILYQGTKEKYKVKMIPIQAKRETNKIFKELVKGEFPKEGKPQSERMLNELAEDSFFIFYSEEENVIVVPAKSINKKTKKFKDDRKKYPRKWSQLKNIKGKQSFQDFFIKCLESVYGEVDPSKIKSISEYVKKGQNVIELVNELSY